MCKWIPCQFDQTYQRPTKTRHYIIWHYHDVMHVRLLTLRQSCDLYRNRHMYTRSTLQHSTVICTITVDILKIVSVAKLWNQTLWLKDATVTRSSMLERLKRSILYSQRTSHAATRAP